MPRLINQYEVRGRLASGGGGVVYSGFDPRLQRPVVLKRLHRGGRTREAVRESALREAQLLSAVEHPNVVGIHDVTESGGHVYLVLPHVPGRNLGQLLAEGPLGLGLLLSVGIQVADGLAAAHRLGIVHRDLKPANVMLTDGGLVKILDFGLARARAPAGRRKGRSGAGKAGAVGGTVAYMAPEQFVTGEVSERSDIFALGVILYEMATGTHPFRSAGAPPHLGQLQMARAIQYLDPVPPRERRPDLPAELEALVLKALAKNPAERFAAAAEVREALRTVARSAAPGAVVPPAVELPAARVPERPTGLLTQLARRLFGATHEAPSVDVLHFSGPAEEAPLLGPSLADALAVRLARIPGLRVRSCRPDERPSATHVLSGTWRRAPEGVSVTWQLRDASSGAVRVGGAVEVPGGDLVSVQNEVGDQIYAAVRGSWVGRSGRPPPAESPLEDDLAETYLEARALLANFALRSSAREQLYAAQDRLAEVLLARPRFAPALSALGLVHLHVVRRGFGGPVELAAAERCFEEALALEPALVEADVHRAHVLIARGEKEAARHAILRLREAAREDFQVRTAAALLLRMDGLLAAALGELRAALALDPARAATVYDQRARIFHYLGQLDRAQEELDRGLRLEPRHPLLRTSQGYLWLRRGEVRRAVAVLESVLEEAPELRLASPTLALAYVAAGERRRAEAMITDETMAAADADGDMAYRIATLFASAGEADRALVWLRKAVYLGNENYPWFAANPAWDGMRPDEGFRSLLAGLETTYRRNRRRWPAALAAGEPGPGSAPRDPTAA